MLACSGVRLLFFPVVAGAAGCDHVHSGINAILGKRNDVFARQVFLLKMVAAVGADIAVTCKQLAVGQAWLEVEGVDVWAHPWCQ